MSDSFPSTAFSVKCRFSSALSGFSLFHFFLPSDPGCDPLVALKEKIAEKILQLGHLVRPMGSNDFECDYQTCCIEVFLPSGEPARIHRALERLKAAVDEILGEFSYLPAEQRRCRVSPARDDGKSLDFHLSVDRQSFQQALLFSLRSFLLRRGFIRTGEVFVQSDLMNSSNESPALQLGLSPDSEDFEEFSSFSLRVLVGSAKVAPLLEFRKAGQKGDGPVELTAALNEKIQATVKDYISTRTEVFPLSSDSGALIVELSGLVKRQSKTKLDLYLRDYWLYRNGLRLPEPAFHEISLTFDTEFPLQPKCFSYPLMAILKRPVHFNMRTKQEIKQDSIKQFDRLLREFSVAGLQGEEKLPIFSEVDIEEEKKTHAPSTIQAKRAAAAAQLENKPLFQKASQLLPEGVSISSSFSSPRISLASVGRLGAGRPMNHSPFKKASEMKPGKLGIKKTFDLPSKTPAAKAIKRPQETPRKSKAKKAKTS